MHPKTFRRQIWNHYYTTGRKMPWRPPLLRPRKNNVLNPYRILVSEFMLQQTQVSRALKHFPSFIRRFPTIRSLATASPREVLHSWQGLGYNRRALNLKRTAETLHATYNDTLPYDYETLASLPGIGPATAGSLQAFVFNLPVVFIETNIRSVYIYHFFNNTKNVHDADILPLIEKTLPGSYPPSVHNHYGLYREWYYALMDYGVYIKKTQGNISTQSAHFKKQSRFEGSNRHIRSQIVTLLLSSPLTVQEIQKKIDPCDERIEKNLITLEGEGLIARRKTRYYIPE